MCAGVLGCFLFFICFLGGGGSSEADGPGQYEYQQMNDIRGSYVSSRYG